jgi:DNA-binding GntR family transcriptional regulator
LEVGLRAKHEDLTEKAYRVLKELVITRAFAPGTKVTAEGLSQRLGVSRTTVKGALDQLAAEGLVEVRPQVGTFVRGLSARDVAALWDARLMVEVFAARRGVVAASEGQRDEVRRLVAAIEPLVEGQDYREDAYAEVVRLNRRLHQLIVETSDNPYLLELYRQLGAQLRIVNFHAHQGFRRADLAQAEHRAIAAAYERRDAELVAETLTRHLERSRDTALAAAAGRAELL